MNAADGASLTIDPLDELEEVTIRLATTNGVIVIVCLMGCDLLQPIIYK